nr:MAG TPA: hypothetical protein [Caudoviricetes sp.]
MSNHWKDSQFWTKVQMSTSDVIRRLKEVGGNEETRYSLARYKKEKTKYSLTTYDILAII